MLAANLRRVLHAVAAHAQARQALTAGDVRHWHADMLAGLAVPEAARLGVAEDDLKGAYRGPPRLGHVGVEVGGVDGTPPAQVAAEVDALLARVAGAAALLDGALGGRPPRHFSAAELRAVCELAGLLHGEWVRIHPFANGNGRTARLLANWALMRWGVQPVLAPRPRPAGGYAAACALSMKRSHEAFVRYLLNEVMAVYAP